MPGSFAGRSSSPTSPSDEQTRDLLQTCNNFCPTTAATRIRCWIEAAALGRRAPDSPERRAQQDQCHEARSVSLSAAGFDDGFCPIMRRAICLDDFPFGCPKQ
jgi:hypothetical protein